MGKKNIYFRPHISTNIKNFPKYISKIDIYNESLFELYLVRNPSVKRSNFSLKKYESFVNELSLAKTYVYYPWRNLIIATLPEQEYFELRTARNRNLILNINQKAYRNMNVGIIGLSIGSASAFFLATSGGAKNMKLADPDMVEISNLNRMHSSLIDVGQNKALVVARKIWEIDPYTNIEVYENKIDRDNLNKFISQTPSLDIVVDAMDDLPMKIILREFCKKKHIPVLMATSNGNRIILDIERFDLNSNLPIFQGRIGNNPKDFTFNTYDEWLQLANKIVDKRILSKEMKKTIKEIGSSIAGVPQLSTTVNLGGIAISNIIKDISSDKNCHQSGRYIIKIGQTSSR